MCVTVGLLKYSSGYLYQPVKKQALERLSQRRTNDTVTRVLELERNGADGRKQRYTYFTPEQREKTVVWCQKWQCCYSQTLQETVPHSWREFSEAFQEELHGRTHGLKRSEEGH